MNKTLVILSLSGVLLSPAQELPRAVHVTDPAFQVRSTKAGLLSFSLSASFQAYQKGGANNWGVKINPPSPLFPNRFWSITSYDYLENCQGTVQYQSMTRQINNKAIIDAINAALQGEARCEEGALGILNTPGSPFAGKFSNTASKLVALNYDNLGQYSPYPPTEDNYYNDQGSPVWNGPYVLNNNPLTGGLSETDGQWLSLSWPNETHINWGRPDDRAQAFSWTGARVFLIDPNNPNPLLRFFDVSRFFDLRESYCKFCWDTMDRVSDGKIVRNASLAVDAPCAGLGSTLCGVSGSGTTRFYWSVGFNNVAECSSLSPNYNLLRFYRTYLGFDPAWGQTFGVSLDDANIAASQNALSFVVSGIGTYKWGYKVLSDGLKWPVGTLGMNVINGRGYSPLCGQFKGSVGISEIDRDSKQLGKAWGLDY